MPVSLGLYFCLNPVTAHLFELEKVRLDPWTEVWPCWPVLPIGFPWSLILGQTRDESEASGPLTPQTIRPAECFELLRDRGHPLVMVAGQFE